MNLSKMNVSVLFFCCATLAGSVAVRQPTEDLLPLNFGTEFEYIFPDSALSLSDDEKIASLNAIMVKHGVKARFYDYKASHEVGAVPQWKIVPDESLVNGFEVVSPPISDLNQVRSVLNAMKDYGAQLSEVTDFHVHVDATGKSVEQIRNVLKNFIMFEAVMDATQPPNHQGNSNVWMQSNSAHFVNPATAYTAFDECEDLACLYDTSQPATGLGPRVHKLNLADHGDSVTLEFRGHHGTLEASEVAAWVKMLNMFVQSSFGGKVAPLVTAALPAMDRMNVFFDLLLNSDDMVKENFFHRIIDQQLKSLTTSADSIYNKPVLSPYDPNLVPVVPNIVIGEKPVISKALY